MNEINHRRARQWIQAELSLPLPQTDREALETHLAGCTGCRAYAQDMQALETRLRQELRVGGELEFGPSALTTNRVLINLRAKTMGTKVRNYAGAAAFVTALALLLLLFATPQGQAWAQSLLRFFTRSESNTLPAPTEIPLVWVEQTPGVPAATPTPLPTLTGAAFSNECGDYRSPRCSIEQIRNKVNFPVKELGVIPASMYFVGATGGPDHVTILYDTQDHSGAIFLTQERWTGSAAQTAWNIGPNAVVETVHIGRNPGEYVKGSFTYRAGESQETWNENAGMQNLRWVDNGVYIVLQRVGPDGQFDRDGMVALAESLTAMPVAARMTPIPTLTPTSVLPTPDKFNLSIIQAGEKAGFSVRAPGILPEVLLFTGAFYDSEQNVVLLSYHYNYSNFPENTDGLLVLEEMISQFGLCKLCDLFVGQHTGIEPIYSGMVGANATIETVQISEIAGQYVEGIWSGTQQGWVWDPTNYVKTLRWQEDGIAFELKYYGMAITKADLIAIAESMK